MTLATPAKVRRALAIKYGSDDGEALVTFYRSPSGYYYFSGIVGQDVPSLYYFNLDGVTVEHVLDHVETHFKRNPPTGVLLRALEAAGKTRPR
jgi:hypothetical protein